jgi:hypothetical protein
LRLFNPAWADHQVFPKNPDPALISDHNDDHLIIPKYIEGGDFWVIGATFLRVTKDSIPQYPD